MGFIDAAIWMAANPFAKSSIAPSSVAFDLLQLDLILAPCSGLTAAARGGALMERGWMKNIQIIIFSIKFAKFTGFFHKFPKSIILTNGCNKKGYHINLSVTHSDLAAKKVFRQPRIFPQLPAFPPAAHQALKPSFINRV
ncbi:MAG: hypothetical protein OXG62_04885 [Nitrospinae bacterium]|nr:hypothetical protein [Nitrospinota bacterium]